jgi:hypothetical protein
MRPAQMGESASVRRRAFVRRILDQDLPAQRPCWPAARLRGDWRRCDEVKGYDALMEFCETQPGELLGDKSYDTDAIGGDLEERSIEPIIPPKIQPQRTDRILARELESARLLFLGGAHELTAGPITERNMQSDVQTEGPCDSGASKLKLLIASDVRFLRDSLGEVLGRNPAVSVIGSCEAQ